MNEGLQTLLDRRLPLPEVAAACVRLPDRSFVSRCYTDWFTTSLLEQLVGRFAETADGLGYHGIQPVRLCWSFECIRVHLALRRDGACLALFVANVPNAPDAELGAVLDKFLALPAL
jgi:hypothetical protein